jgi:16S rRNA U516 pseudouridylate synthase RsuA-like enzyme
VTQITDGLADNIDTGMPFLTETTMADDLNKRGAQDRSRINLSEDHEVRYWTTALGVPVDELRRLVAEVGDSAEAIRDALVKKARQVS